MGFAGKPSGPYITVVREIKSNTTIRINKIAHKAKKFLAPAKPAFSTSMLLVFNPVFILLPAFNAKNPAIPYISPHIT